MEALTGDNINLKKDHNQYRDHQGKQKADQNLSKQIYRLYVHFPFCGILFSLGLGFHPLSFCGVNLELGAPSWSRGTGVLGIRSQLRDSWNLLIRAD